MSRADQNEPNLSGAQRELEAALGSLAPDRQTGLDPVAAAFDAGRLSAHGQLRVWQGASLQMAHPRPSAGPIAVVTNLPSSIQRPSEESVMRLQQRVLENGVDALPPVRWIRVPDLSPREF